MSKPKSAIDDYRTQLWQIAAEAWDKAIALYTESGNRQEAINEVLAAIEKATEHA